MLIKRHYARVGYWGSRERRTIWWLFGLVPVWVRNRRPRDAS